MLLYIFSHNNFVCSVQTDSFEFSQTLLQFFPNPNFKMFNFSIASLNGENMSQLKND